MNTVLKNPALQRISILCGTIIFCVFSCLEPEELPRPDNPSDSLEDQDHDATDTNALPDGRTLLGKQLES